MQRRTPPTTKRQEDAARERPVKDYKKSSSRRRMSPHKRLQILTILVTLAGTVVVLTTLFFVSNSNAASGVLRRRTEEVNPVGTCIADPSQLPKYWQPPDHHKLDESPWTAEEQALSDESLDKALDELIDFYASISEERILALGNDAVTSLMDEVCASEHLPAFHQKAMIATARNLKISTKKYVSTKNHHYPGCSHTYRKMKFVAYADYLLQRMPEDTELKSIRDTLVKRTNAMFWDCGTIDNVVADRMGLDKVNLKAMLATPNLSRRSVWDMLLAAIALVDCMTVPELDIPEGTEDFVAGIWAYLADWEVPYARDVEGGFNDDHVRMMGYAVTHAAYVPTGYGRHTQLISDAPWIFQYIRENFYWALDGGDMDLIAEFLDLFRQYGCDEDNDIQTRHGTRWLLDMYKKAGNSWMGNAKMEYDEPDDYEMIHKPWTAIGGIERKQMEPQVPGSYGYAFRKALEKAAQNAAKVSI